MKISSDFNVENVNTAQNDRILRVIRAFSSRKQIRAFNEMRRIHESAS